VREGEMEGAWLWSQVDLVSFPALTLLAVCLLSKSPNLDLYFFICKMQEFIPIQRLQKKKQKQKKKLQKNVEPKTRREDNGDSEQRNSGRLKWEGI